MAWYTGNFVNTNAGNLITVFDAYLPLNDKWSIHDAEAGTNQKVYKCLDEDENSRFYVNVKDNQASYAVIELWEGWDEVTHAGWGRSVVASATYELRINRPVGGWQMSVKDHRIIFINAVACATYIGQLKRFDTSKNMPVYIGELTGTGKYNPLAYYSTSTVAGWRMLFDEGGNTGGILEPYARISSSIYIKTTAGTFLIFEHPAYNEATSSLIGLLEGVVYLFSSSQGFSRWQTVELNGVDWMAINGDYSTKYWNLIEKA